MRNSVKFADDPPGARGSANAGLVQAKRNKKYRNLKSFSEMIQESGGNGWYQKQMVAAVIAAMLIAHLLFISLPLLLLVPQFNCYNEQHEFLANYECVPANFCSDSSVKPDILMNKYYLQNWINEFNMVCVAQTEITSFYLLTFMGIAFGAFFLGFASDVYGKKLMFVIGLVCIGAIYVLILYLDNYEKI